MGGQKLEKLKERLHFLGAGNQARHTVFVDSEHEARSFSAEDFFDTPAELLGRVFNRPHRSQLEEPDTVSGAPEPTGDVPVSDPSGLERYSKEYPCLTVQGFFCMGEVKFSGRKAGTFFSF